MANVVAGRVLLLNGSTWEPLAVISVPRAVNLVLAGKAIIVEKTKKWLRSPSTRFPVPAVIALRYYVNVPRRNARWSRKGILMRDNYTCIYCGARIGDVVRGQVMVKADFTVDHIMPRSRGGKDTWINTAVACKRCNVQKADRTPSEAGMKLRWEPKMPRTSYLVIRIGNGPDSWRKYIELPAFRRS